MISAQKTMGKIHCEKFPKNYSFSDSNCQSDSQPVDWILNLKFFDCFEGFSIVRF
jgi:hypothetical protein